MGTTNFGWTIWRLRSGRPPRDGSCCESHPPARFAQLAGSSLEVHGAWCDCLEVRRGASAGNRI